MQINRIELEGLPGHKALLSRDHCDVDGAVIVLEVFTPSGPHLHVGIAGDRNHMDLLASRLHELLRAGTREEYAALIGSLTR